MFKVLDKQAGLIWTNRNKLILINSDSQHQSECGRTCDTKITLSNKARKASTEFRKILPKSKHKTPRRVEMRFSESKVEPEVTHSTVMKEKSLDHQILTEVCSSTLQTARNLG